MKNPEELSESKRGLLERVLREEMARQTWEAPVHPRAPGTTVPLAPSQQQVWLHSQMGDPRFVYNEPITIHYHGPLDHSVFEHSFHEFLRRHEIWRTTNGKLDRNALPEPEAVESAGPYVAPASDIKRRLARIFESVLDVPRIGMRENFFDLGGHSLLVAKLLRRIELEFGKRLTMPTIFQSPTIEHLASLLGERNYLEAGAATVDIRPAGAHAPFFWIYGGPFFSSLASRLHLAHPFVSVALDPDDERAIGSSRTFPTLTQIAEPLVGKIRAAQPAGPYRLGGWCADGLIAYEVASQLVAAGEQVQLLAMVGTPNPVYYLSLQLGRSTPASSGIA